MYPEVVIDRDACEFRPKFRPNELRRPHGPEARLAVRWVVELAGLQWPALPLTGSTVCVLLRITNGAGFVDLFNALGRYL